MNEKPTEQQVASACFSLRHDFGLLPDDVQAQYKQACKEWWLAIAKEVNTPSNHPMVVENAKGEK